MPKGSGKKRKKPSKRDKIGNMPRNGAELCHIKNKCTADMRKSPSTTAAEMTGDVATKGSQWTSRVANTRVQVAGAEKLDLC